MQQNFPTLGHELAKFPTISAEMEEATASLVNNAIF